LEEGTDDFEVRDSVFRRVLGNGVWTHSTFQSPRNFRGVIAGNEFATIGRDAIQVGHASAVRVEDNRGRLIGFPHDIVDVENGGIPVAVDTAGKVDRSIYTRNHFEEINGKCFDLDGFHDGEVSFNRCVNRGTPENYPWGGYALVMNNANPDMQTRLITVHGNVFDGTRYGGIFVIGHDHRIVNNTLRNLNKARCMDSGAVYGCTGYQGDPGLLEAGIYLGTRAEREAPARNNVVEGNVISGYRMKQNCIRSEPMLSPTANRVQGNRCSDHD
jgi:hypothetical protein